MRCGWLGLAAGVLLGVSGGVRAQDMLGQGSGERMPAVREINPRHQVGPSGTHYLLLGRGLASHYGLGDGFQGKRTANGETFDRDAMTCATHLTALSDPVPRGRDAHHVPGQVWVRVVWEDDQHQAKNFVFVRVTDRGPYETIRYRDAKGRRRRRQIPHRTRVIDLSTGAMRALVRSFHGERPDLELIPVSVWLLRDSRP